MNTRFSVINHDDVIAHLPEQVRFGGSADISAKCAGRYLGISSYGQATNVHLKGVIDEVHMAKEVVVLTASYQTEIGVGAIIVQADRVLLVRRAHPPLQGEWSIPGGLVETGETTKEAVIREVREETGLHIEPVRLVEVFERILRDRDSRVQYHFVLIDYLCRPVSGEAQPGSDVTEVQWAKLDDVESLGVAPESFEVMRKAMR